jgi:hypothetical protein
MLAVLFSVISSVDGDDDTRRNFARTRKFDLTRNRHYWFNPGQRRQVVDASVLFRTFGAADIGLKNVRLLKEFKDEEGNQEEDRQDGQEVAEEEDRQEVDEDEVLEVVLDRWPFGLTTTRKAGRSSIRCWSAGLMFLMDEKCRSESHV